MKLLVTADDFGYSARRDEGILAASVMQGGLVSRVSLMVNGKSALTAVKAVRDAENVKIGLHLNLTEGEPICAKEEIPSLLKEDGCFRGAVGLRKAAKMGNLVEDELRKEIVAQIEQFKELRSGALPSYIDGHNHAHVQRPICQILGKVMCEYGVVTTRIPFEPVLPEPFLQSVTEEKQNLYRAIIVDSEDAEEVFTSFGVKACADAFVGVSLMGKNLTLKGLSNCLLALPSNIDSCELMTHPGFPCEGKVNEEGCGPDGPDLFSKSEDRRHELEFLRAPETRGWLATELDNIFQNRLDDSKGTVCIMSRLIPATGNYTTCRRLAKILQDLNYTTFMLNAVDIRDIETVRSLFHRHQVSTIVALNALRVHHIFTQLDFVSIRKVMITGGTDINALPDDPNDLKHGDDIWSAVCAFAKADVIVSFNEEMKFRLTKAITHIGSTVPPVHIIPQGFDASEVRNLAQHEENSGWSLREKLGLAKEDIMLLLIAGLRQVKDPMFLFDIVKKIDECISERQVKLIIIGPALHQELSKMVISSCNNSKHAQYHEPLPYAQILRAIMEADVLINSSKSEGMSGAILEAMALGTLVIAKNIEGNRKLIQNNKTGLLFDTPEEFETQFRRVFQGEIALKAKLETQAKIYVTDAHGIAKEKEAYAKLLI